MERKPIAEEWDAKYVAFLRLFNIGRDYYACHDVMEELWLEEGRDPFWQGLLQAAVGLYHWENGNFSGSYKLFAGASAKLAAYPDVYAGVDAAALRREVKRSMDRLREWRGEGGPAFAAFRIEVRDPGLAEAAGGG